MNFGVILHFDVLFKKGKKLKIHWMKNTVSVHQKPYGNCAETQENSWFTQGFHLET